MGLREGFFYCFINEEDSAGLKSSEKDLLKEKSLLEGERRFLRQQLGWGPEQGRRGRPSNWGKDGEMDVEEGRFVPLGAKRKTFHFLASKSSESRSEEGQRV